MLTSDAAISVKRRRIVFDESNGLLNALHIAMGKSI